MSSASAASAILRPDLPSSPLRLGPGCSCACNAVEEVEEEAVEEEVEEEVEWEETQTRPRRASMLLRRRSGAT